MPIEISCKNVGITVHVIAKELRRTLSDLFITKNIKVFIATHKSLFIFIDDTLEMNSLLKNVEEILNRFRIQCELKPLTRSGYGNPSLYLQLVDRSYKGSVLDNYLMRT
jgi:hypothetical protein